MSLGHFGAALRRQRVAAGLSMGQVARRIGTSTSFLHRVETGVAAPLSTGRVLEVGGIVGGTEGLLRALGEERGGIEVPWPAGEEARAALVAIVLGGGR